MQSRKNIYLTVTPRDVRQAPATSLLVFDRNATGYVLRQFQEKAQTDVAQVVDPSRAKARKSTAQEVSTVRALGRSPALSQPSGTQEGWRPKLASEETDRAGKRDGICLSRREIDNALIDVALENQDSWRMTDYTVGTELLPVCRQTGRKSDKG